MHFSQIKKGILCTKVFFFLGGGGGGYKKLYFIVQFFKKKNIFFVCSFLKNYRILYHGLAEYSILIG